MKLLKYILISLLVLGVLLIAPARTQTASMRLPRDLNVAICLNNWDRASALVQQLLDSSTLSSDERVQLGVLSSQIADYRTNKTSVDQSDACATAIAPAKGARNRTAIRRQNRSVEEGDYHSEAGGK